jgi:hypothetical protein
MKHDYSPRLSDLKLTPAMLDLVRRRTMPFLDNTGLTRPLSDLMAEAYLQGMQDAVQGFTHEP